MIERTCSSSRVWVSCKGLLFRHLLCKSRGLCLPAPLDYLKDISYCQSQATNKQTLPAILENGLVKVSSIIKYRDKRKGRFQEVSNSSFLLQPLWGGVGRRLGISTAGKSLWPKPNEAGQGVKSGCDKR